MATIFVLSSGAYGQSEFDEAKLLAEQGLARAQNYLGIMHANGDGVPQSNVRAYIWWSVAAAQGQEDAKRNRGLITERLTPDQLTQAQQIATRCIDSDYQDCE